MIDATELELEGKEGGASAAVSYRALSYMINGQERAKGSAELCKQVPLERMFWLWARGEGRNKQRGRTKYELVWSKIYKGGWGTKIFWRGAQRTSQLEHQSGTACASIASCTVLY